MEKRPALGKGLSALIPDAPEPPRSTPTEADIDRLAPNEFQPRVTVDDSRLRELAESIKANGIIQPIIVRRDGDRSRSSPASAGGAPRSSPACCASRSSCATSRPDASSRCSRWRSSKTSSARI
jgi:hypothetical protein